MNIVKILKMQKALIEVGKLQHKTNIEEITENEFLEELKKFPKKLRNQSSRGELWSKFESFEVLDFTSEDLNNNIDSIEIYYIYNYYLKDLKSFEKLEILRNLVFNELYFI